MITRIFHIVSENHVVWASIRSHVDLLSIQTECTMHNVLKNYDLIEDIRLRTEFVENELRKVLPNTVESVTIEKAISLTEYLLNNGRQMT